MKQFTRRTIALTFSTCGALVLSYLAVMGNNEALIALVGIVMAVIGFYFGAKSNSEPPK